MRYQNLKTIAFALLLGLIWSCSNDQEDTTPQNPMNDDDNNPGASATVWDGGTITFTKDADSDPTDAANQDRITDNVWITRGNSGGQIYNAVTESSANQDSSPAGTLWARGELSNAENLTFTNFRAAVGRPQDVVGQNLVLFLPDDNVVMSVRFTQWSRNRQGGFAYERSTQ